MRAFIISILLCLFACGDETAMMSASETDLSSYTTIPGMITSHPYFPLRDGTQDQFHYIRLDTNGEKTFYDQIYLSIKNTISTTIDTSFITIIDSTYDENNILIIDTIKTGSTTTSNTYHQVSQYSLGPNLKGLALIRVENEGVYIIGSYDNKSNLTSGDTLLWFPEQPEITKSWQWPDRSFDYKTTHKEYQIASNIKSTHGKITYKTLKNVMVMTENHGNVKINYYLQEKVGIVKIERFEDGYLQSYFEKSTNQDSYNN
jgi:hypothetical protein